jgi:conjugal transfer pilus assembly protein TraE
MDFKRFTGTIAFLRAENRLLKFAVVVIAASNVFFGLLSYTAVRTKQVVVVPLTPAKSIVVGRKPDPMYVLQVARFVFDSLLTYTPCTVKKQYEQILPLFHPSVYATYKKIFETFVENARQAKLASAFMIDRITHCPQKNVIKVEGQKLTIFEDSIVERKKVTYELRYTVRYGQFRILSYKKLRED